MCHVKTLFLVENLCVGEYMFFLYWPWNHVFVKSRYLNRHPFFSQLTTQSPKLIQEFLLGHSQRHISSGDGNLREPEYIPCRILLGLSANTLFGGV